MLERNPALKPSEVRAILMRTARDLGSPGRDDLFGAGEADALAAVSAVVAAAPAVPVAAVSDAPAAGKVSEPQQVPPTRDLNPPVAAMASKDLASKDLASKELASKDSASKNSASDKSAVHGEIGPPRHDSRSKWAAKKVKKNRRSL